MGSPQLLKYLGDQYVLHLRYVRSAPTLCPYGTHTTYVRQLHYVGNALTLRTYGTYTMYALPVDRNTWHLPKEWCRKALKWWNERYIENKTEEAVETVVKI